MIGLPDIRITAVVRVREIKREVVGRPVGLDHVSAEAEVKKNTVEVIVIGLVGCEPVVAVIKKMNSGAAV